MTPIGLLPNISKTAGDAPTLANIC